MAGQTNIGGDFYISTTAENADLDQAGFEALSWTLVPNMGNHGDTGTSQNVTTYSTWDRRVLTKGKGEANAQDPVVEFLDEDNSGIQAMDAAAVVDNTDKYAFKVEWPDGKIEYNRGLVTGPMKMKGGNEDFRRKSYTLGLDQVGVDVEPV